MRAIPIDNFFSDLEERGSEAPVALDWRRIVAEGRAARATADGGRWRIGMLALLVERRYASGALQRFAEEIGESYSTVRRYRWVAKAYDPPARTRFADLSFSHFQSVAGLPDKLVWLERAERGAWSVDRLVRESRASSATTTSAAAALDRLRASIDGMNRWVEPASMLDDVALAEAGKEWLGEALDELAEKVARLRIRVHTATRNASAPRGPKVARIRKTRPRPKRSVAQESSRSRATALKARAVGR